MSKPRTIKGYHFQADLIRSSATIILCYLFCIHASCNNNKNYLYNIFLNYLLLFSQYRYDNKPNRTNKTAYWNISYIRTIVHTEYGRGGGGG
jgi:hypothetical protein